MQSSVKRESSLSVSWDDQAATQSSRVRSTPEVAMGFLLPTVVPRVTRRAERQVQQPRPLRATWTVSDSPTNGSALADHRSDSGGSRYLAACSASSRHPNAWQVTERSGPAVFETRTVRSKPPSQMMY